MAVTLVRLIGISEQLRYVKIFRHAVLEYRLDLSRKQYALLYDLLDVLGDPPHIWVNDYIPHGDTSVRRVIEVSLNGDPVISELQALVEARLEHVLQEE
jgi:hypothetical protein